MSVVAFDGRILAADKRVTYGSQAQTVTKLWRRRVGTEPFAKSVVFTGTGNGTALRVMVEWWLAGADYAAYPKCQENNDEWARLIVALSPTDIRHYERFPAHYPIEDPFWAVGSGADVANGALAHGATAIQAIETTARFINSCGNGWDAVDLETMEIISGKQSKETKDAP